MHHCKADVSSWKSKVFFISNILKGFDAEKTKALMKKNLRGELTEVRLKEKYSFNNSHMVMAIADLLRADDSADIKEIH